jgi:ribose transport system permease protein
VILIGVLADQQLQSRRRRKAALASPAPRSTLVQGKQSASPRGGAAMPTRAGDQA